MTKSAPVGRCADVTLITSTYASGRHIRKFSDRALALFSSLASHGVRGQLVVVANEPTAVERRALNQLAQTSVSIPDFSLKTFVVSRESVYASWNRGLAAAEGQLLGFWNVDDWRNTAAILEGLDLLRRGHRLVYFPWVEVQAFGWPLPAMVGSPSFPDVPEFDRSLFQSAMNIGPFFLLDRGLLDVVGCFDEQFRIAGDFEWAVRAARATDFFRGRSIGGVFLRNPLGLSGSGHPRHAAERNVIRLRHGTSGDLETVSPALMAEYFRPTDAVALLTVGGQNGLKMPLESGQPPFSEEAWRRTQRSIRCRRLALWLPRYFARVVGWESSFERALTRLRSRT